VVIEKDGEYELRRYAPMIVAETRVEGPFAQASSDGFGLIAGYIFGANRASSGAPVAIAMTAPVVMEPTPVEYDTAGPVTMEGGEGRWRMTFFMPPSYTMDTLPKPIDPRVTLRELPERLSAAVVFPGIAGEDDITRRSGPLLAWLAERGHRAVSAPRLARYSRPGKQAELRRNEILVYCR
jgi:hypothetical protein